MLRLSRPPVPGNDLVDDLLARSDFADCTPNIPAGINAEGYHELTNSDELTVEVCSSALPDGGKVWLFSDATERRQLDARLRRIEHIRALEKCRGRSPMTSATSCRASRPTFTFLAPSPAPIAALDGAQSSIEMGTAMIQRLLAFAKRQPLSPEDVDVAVLLSVA